MDDHVFIKQIQGETSKVDVESMTQFTIERLMNEVAEKCGIGTRSKSLHMSLSLFALRLFTIVNNIPVAFTNLEE